MAANRKYAKPMSAHINILITQEQKKYLTSRSGRYRSISDVVRDLIDEDMDRQKEMSGDPRV